MSSTCSESNSDPIGQTIAAAAPVERELDAGRAALLFDRALVESFKRSRRATWFRRWTFAGAGAAVLGILGSIFATRPLPKEEVTYVSAIPLAAERVKTPLDAGGTSHRLAPVAVAVKPPRQSGALLLRAEPVRPRRRGARERRYVPVASNSSPRTEKQRSLEESLEPSGGFQLVVRESTPDARGYARVSRSLPGRAGRVTCVVENDDASTDRVSIARAEPGRAMTELSIETKSSIDQELEP